VRITDSVSRGTIRFTHTIRYDSGLLEFEGEEGLRSVDHAITRARSFRRVTDDAATTARRLLAGEQDA